MEMPASSDGPLLLHGDCLEVMPTLPAQAVKMVFADLPYGSKNFCSTNCYWDVAIDLTEFWREAIRISSNVTPYIFTGAQPFTTDLINSNKKLFRYCLVWDKVGAGNFVKAKFAPMRNHEDVAVFYKAQPTYNPQMILREKPRQWKPQAVKKSLSGGVTNHDLSWTKTYTHKYPRSIIVASSRADKSRGLHPTLKPVALLEWLIKTYTNPADTVLDPVAGSGTTAIAAMRTGRKAICIEKDKGYYDIMVKRVADERARMHQEEMVL